MVDRNQLKEFAMYFHQDFGDSPGDSLQNNISSFFVSPHYDDGRAFIDQIDEFTKIVFSPGGRGSSWRKLGAGRWSKELENPHVWEAIKTLAQEFPDRKSALNRREEFDTFLSKLLAL